MSQLNKDMDNENVDVDVNVVKIVEDNINELKDNENLEPTIEKNKNDNITKNKKKMSKNKKIIIFLIVFILISVCITYGAIYYTLHRNVENPLLTDEKVDINKEDDLKILSLTEKYSQNSIETNEVKFIEGEYTKVSEYYEYYKVEIIYDQISGLKDKVVEDKINQEIKDKVFSFYDKKYLTDKNVNTLKINANIVANFSNVLSVNIYGTVIYNTPENSWDTLADTGINFRLDTGENLNFKDLFISSANINNIVASAEYKKLAWDELQEPGQLDMSKINTSDYEEEIILVVNKFKEDDNIDFYFSPRTITFKIDGVKDNITITMEDFYDSIAIYKRYMNNKKLYENSNLNLNKIYVFGQKDAQNVYKYEDVTDNLFIDCEIFNNKIKDTSKIVEKVKTQIDEKIENLKIANKNLGTAYKTNIDIYYDKDKNYFQVFTETYINTMSISYYKDNIHSLIAEYERKQKVSMGGNYFYNYEGYTGNSRLYNNSNIKIEQSNTNLKYDLDGNLLDDKNLNNQVPTNTTPTATDKVNIYQNS